MRLFGWGAKREQKANGDVLSVDQLIRRLEVVYETASGVAVTPENCEESPTIKAIVTAVTRRFAVMPVHVYQKTTSLKGASKELQPSHPVERLLSRPNDWQTRVEYWMDAVSWLIRYGEFLAVKARGQTGPIRFLYPVNPSAVEVRQDDNLNVSFMVTRASGGRREYAIDEVHRARFTSRDGLKANSPVMDVRESIALEIVAEKFGAGFFGNGAMPGIAFEFTDGSAGFKTDEERHAFMDEFQERFGKRNRFKAILPPKGIKVGTQLPLENNKAQFIELRALQRTIIAGAFGVPPHLVGDLSKGTFNNVEQQGIEFKQSVILPLVRIFEAAMERDLLTTEDRNKGIIIRFNPDGDLRGDFKTRQEGLAIQRQNGVINANEWREVEGMNPRADDGGDDYYATGPSGQTPAGNPAPADPGADQGDDPNAA